MIETHALVLHSIVEMSISISISISLLVSWPLDTIFISILIIFKNLSLFLLLIQICQLSDRCMPQYPNSFSEPAMREIKPSKAMHYGLRDRGYGQYNIMSKSTLFDFLKTFVGIIYILLYICRCPIFLFLFD